MKFKQSIKSFLLLAAILFAGTNTVKAINMSGMTPEVAETQAFWARLTAKPATTTTGSGKVFVVSAENYSGDPTDGDYVAESYDEGWSDIFIASSLINADVAFRTFAKADNGSYFKGWSFTDGYTDLGTEISNFSIEVTPSSTKGHSNVRNYFLYAAFEQIKLVSSEMISGSQTTADDGAGNWTCTQIIKFRAETPGVWALSSAGDERHFKRPVLTKKTGTTGTWKIDDAAWNTSGAGQNVTLYGDYAELTVPVTFTAPNSDAAEYGAELVLETYAGVKLKAYLSARTVVAGAQAIRYNKSKVYQAAGDLTTLLTNAAADDIIKLNGNYSGAVSINKNITFDLNGYTLSNTLTVSGGNVTLAYSAFGGTINNNVSVSAGKLTLTGGTITGNINVSAGATLEQNGASINGTVTNAGTMTTTDGSITGQLASSGTLTLNGGTFTNNSGVAVNITGGTAQIKRGTISGSTYGVQSVGTTTIEKLAAITGVTKALNGTGGSLTVNNGKFSDPANLYSGTVTFNAGYFRTNNAGGSTALGKQVWRNTAGAEAREGYDFFVGNQEAAQASNVSVCRIGHTSYNSLEEALAYANNSGNDVIIIMENDYVLPAGYYTLPANATLIVPKSNDQETANRIVPRETSGSPAPVSFRKLIFESGVNMSVSGTIELTCTQYGSGETMGIPGGNYGHLILKPGSHMTLNSGGELRAWGFVTGDGTKDGVGNYLSGEIDARRGSTVREMFQMGDWKGGDVSFTIAMDIPGMDPSYRDLTHLFPVYMYFIQNVESPVKYHPGSSLICAASVNVAGSINAYANDIKVVGKEGEPAMFLMNEMADAENTWVRKYYDAKNDKQVYEVNSGAQLGSMVIDLGEVPAAMIKPGTPGTLKLELDSRKFVLPLTSNFKIHLLSGNMQFTQSTSCLPGMEVEIDKESTISIVNLKRDDVVEGALYLYDADQWSFQNNQMYGYVGDGGKFGAIVKYSATWDLGTNGATKRPNVRNISTPAKIGDAILNVHGTFRMGEDCSVYTTWSKNMETFQLDESGTGGASIISTNEDAGTFIYDADAPEFDGLHFDGEGNITGFGPSVIINYDHNDYGLGTMYPVQINTVMGKTGWRAFGFELCSPAKLKNGDGTFASTAGTAEGKSYCYMNDRWTLMEVASENDCFMKDNYGAFYAKPAEYVAVNATAEYDSENDIYVMIGNEDHTFSDAAGAGRLFILMDNCQWWEVEQKDNLYHCIHPDNDTYYFWVDEQPDPDDPEAVIPAHWEEKRFTITWKNWNGDIIQTADKDGNPVNNYSVTYGTMAEFLGTNPTREPNIDYTYDFTGWSPELAPVTQDVTYTATFEQKDRKYTIIFLQEGGSEIERHFLKHNDVPVCENTPTKTGFTLVWSPAIAAVTGDATYTATWLEEPPTAWDVTFVNNAGGVLQPTAAVGVNEHPTYSGASPAKENADHTAYTSNEYTCTFNGWDAVIDGVKQHFAPGATLPCPTAPTTYTATYTLEATIYEVRFYQENGTTQIGEMQSLHYGDMPVAPTGITKQEPEEGYSYTYMWQNIADASKTIETVKANANYKPVFTGTLNKYTVTLRSNNDAVCTFTGAGVYNYGTTINIVAAINSDYEFVSWDGDVAEVDDWTDDKHGGTITSLEKDITLTLTVKSADKEVKNKTVGVDETYDVNAGDEVMDLIIQSDGTASGQITNAGLLRVDGKAHFDLQLSSAAAQTWYSFGLPWKVSTTDGISVNGRTLTLTKDIYLIEFDAAACAAGDLTNNYWKYVNAGTTLQPGKLYMLYLRNGASTIRFTKVTNNSVAPIVNNTIKLDENPSSVPARAGWNAIANPTTSYATLAISGVTTGQVYKPGVPDEEGNPTDRFDPVTLSSTSLIVGQPLFVQVGGANAGAHIADANNKFSAPRRVAETSSKYEIRLTSVNATDFADRLYIQASDEKEDKYIIGQDLAKMGTSRGIAQMWINRYNTKLCANVVEPTDDQAVFPLSIYAPKDGDYTISTITPADDYEDIYVTLDGAPVWDLSVGAYTVNLKAGNTDSYGLLIVKRPVPEVVTSIEYNTQSDNSVRKVLINGQVFIIRDGMIYSIFGQKVK